MRRFFIILLFLPLFVSSWGQEHIYPATYSVTYPVTHPISGRVFRAVTEATSVAVSYFAPGIVWPQASDSITWDDVDTSAAGDFLNITSEGRVFRMNKITPPPQYASAVFWLNGTISGDNAIDVKNGWEFPLINNDLDNLYGRFIFKSQTLISPPAKGTAAADSIIKYQPDNFWYANTDSTPQQIPVHSFYQNTDFEDLSFAQHRDRVTGTDSVEIIPPGIDNIILYSSAQTANLPEMAAYFGPEVNKVAGQLEVGSGKTYATIQSALNAANDNDTIYVFTGDYVEAYSGTYGIRVLDDVHIIAVGHAKLSSASTHIAASTTAGTDWILEGFDIDVTVGTNTSVVFLSSTTGSMTMERCYSDSAAGSYTIFSNPPTTVNNSVFHNNMYANDPLTVSGCLFPTDDARFVQCLVDETKDLKFYYNDITGAISTEAFDISAGGSTVYIYYNTLNDYLFRNINNDDFPAIYLGYNNVTVTKNNSPVQIITGTVDDIDIIGNIITEPSDVSASTDNILIRNQADVVIQGNTISRKSRSPIWLDVNTTITPIQYLIKENTIRNTSSNGTIIIGNENGTADFEFEDKVIIEGNDITGPSTANSQHGIFLTRQDGIIRYNYLDSMQLGILCKGDGEAFSNTVIHHNIIHNGSNAYLSKGAESVRWYNNILVNDFGYPYPTFNYGIELLENLDGENSVNNIIKNNIFACFNDTLYSGGLFYPYEAADTVGLEMDYNLFYHAADTAYIGSTDAGIEGDTKYADITVLGYNGNGVNADPLFTNYLNGVFTLLSGSPARKAGILVSGFNTGLNPSTTWGILGIITKESTSPPQQGVIAY